MTTVTTFRLHFPEFTDVTRYPDAQVTFWLGVGTKLLSNTRRWGTLLDHGLELFLAHHLSIAAKNFKAGRSGAAPGEMTGAVSAKAVDKVSVAYDTNAGIMPDAGHWNLTTYGVQFIQLARMVGAGGVQL